MVLPFLLFGGPLLDGTSSFFAIGHDALEQSYSWMQLLTRSLHQGFLPLWDPYTQGGHTFVGEIQAGVFYPVSWLFAFAFGSTQGIGMPALEALVGVHFAVASLGFYWFAREAGGSRVAAFAGAILFAYFGPVAFRASAQVGIFFGLCWMPWALAFAWRFLRSGRRLEAFACGLVVGMQVVAGHIQPAFHTVLLICSLILFARWASGWRAMFNRKSLAAVALFGAGIAAVSLPQLLLAIQYLSDAYRWVGLNDPIGPWQRVPLDVFLAQHIITPLTLLSIVNPWQFSASDGNILYLGLAALLLCMTYLFRPGTKGVGPQLLPVRGWNLSVMVISLLLAMGSFGMIAMLIYPVPLMTAVRELGRYVILFHFAAAFVMVLAVDRLVRTGELQQRARSWPWWFVAVVAGYSAWLLFYRQTQVIRPVAIQLAGVAGALMILKWLPRLALGALFVNIALCAFITRDFVLPTLQDGRKLPTAYFPDSPILRALHDAAEKGRILIEKDADLPQNYGMVTGIESKFGYSATYYRPYFDFISQDWNINSRVNDLLNVRWVISKKSQDLPL
ncbi:MAG: hypothetical protein HY255_05505, partial [Betaproteobacteria bacterium]|nr:hypothetical protein [Betaproteobacteria bacterium]